MNASSRPAGLLRALQGGGVKATTKAKQGLLKALGKASAAKEAADGKMDTK